MNSSQELALKVRILVALLFSSSLTQITCNPSYNQELIKGSESEEGLSLIDKRLTVVTINGFSNQNLIVEYALTLDDVSPKEGSIGGGTKVSVSRATDFPFNLV